MAQKFLTPIDLTKLELQNARIQNLAAAPSSPVTGQIYYDTVLNKLGCYQNATWVYLDPAVAGVSSISVSSTNGLAGTSSGGSTPVLTLSTTVTGLLKGNGTSISAAVVRTDYAEPTTALATGILKSTTGTGALSIAIAGDFPTLNQNTTGSASSFTGSLAGDVTGTQAATVVGKINGVSLASLATGILKNTTTTGVPSIAIAADFPTLNQNTTGSAATLTTARSIYGNVFDGSAALTQIIASTFGGTGNGFTKFSGPTTTEKTFILPDANGTLVVYNATGTFTAAQTFGSAGSVGKLIIAGNTSGSTILNASAVASGTITLPAATDTLVGKATTDVLTNKSIDGSTNTLTNIAESSVTNLVSDLALKAPLASPTFTGTPSLPTGTIAVTQAPGNSSTAIATTAFVSGEISTAVTAIKWKQSVRVSTTVAGTLATSFANGSVIDGITLATGDRILIKDQAAPAENGIYTVNASGAPTRSTDADTASEIKGAVVSVNEGTVNQDTAWQLITDTITLNTTSLVFTDFIKANVPTATTTIQGKVALATQAEAEAKADTTKAVTSADLINFPIKKVFTIGDGTATAYAVTHNLGTQDVQVQVRDAATNAVVIVDIVNSSTTVSTITFAVAPASNSYKVVVIG